MKYRYYILDIYDGTYSATNERSVVDSYLVSDDFFVLDTEEDLMLCPGGGSVSVRDLDKEMADE